MAKRDGAKIRTKPEIKMNDCHLGEAELAPASSRKRPVAIALKDVTASGARICQPASECNDWLNRLQNALGTTSMDFVNTSLFQLQSTARLPGSGISEIAMNAALAIIEAAKPQDEIEAALAVQMACTHNVAMAVLSRCNGWDKRISAMGSAAARLLNVYTAQVETLRRIRGGGRQHVRVEHVHISESLTRNGLFDINLLRVALT